MALDCDTILIKPEYKYGPGGAVTAISAITVVCLDPKEKRRLLREGRLAKVKFPARKRQPL